MKEYIVTAQDGIDLFVRDNRVSDDHLLVLCHGRSANISGYADRQEMFGQRGISTLAYDQRGAKDGKSDGDFSTFTTTQRTDDLREILTYAFTLGYQNVSLSGTSLGALQSIVVADEFENLHSLVLRATVADSAQILASRKDLSEVFKEDADKYGKEVIAAYAQKIGIPILMIHGEKDEIASYDDAVELYTKLQHGSGFICVPNAGHDCGGKKTGEMLLERTVYFLNR
ncbi:hypothetical protein BVX95_01260 [archaeon D22]|nr:hypothetical protein BVX95_01260 [archaeon D22]